MQIIEVTVKFEICVIPKSLKFMYIWKVGSEAVGWGVGEVGAGLCFMVEMYEPIKLKCHF